MSQLVLRPEPLTAEAFAPFGFLFEPQMRAPDFECTTRGTRSWEFPFHGGDLRMFLIETQPRPLVINKLEKHTDLSQVFMPSGGGPAVLIVGRAADEQSLPDKEGLRAFLLDGSVGYGLHPHTWHSLDRMPLQDTPTRWVMFTDHKTHDDLPLVAEGTAQYTHEINTLQTLGVELIVRP
ncbi:MAG TPA: ureidoglycolate lyase [Paenalcaligenes sp.]|nr:ureidoglycolate lyase [Paenalcaligenes sp.]